MENNKLTIVCYMGGMCGDLLTALIDSTNMSFVNGSVKLQNERSKLKKPHLFKTDDEKDLYISNVSKIFKSIPSHDLKYHVLRKHKFISIVVNDRRYSDWAATRFKNLHRPEVWHEMTKFSNCATVEQYSQMMLDYSNMIKKEEYSSKIINLEDILGGRLVEVLKMHQTNLTNECESIYNSWLKLQKFNL